MKHLAVFDDRNIIEKILKEEKRVEGRFSRKKMLPYDKIKKGDIIYLKESGGLIFGQAEVNNVLFYDNLTPEMISKIRKEYQEDLCVSENFWQKHGKSKFVTLIFLKNPERIFPTKYKKKDRRGWVA